MDKSEIIKQYGSIAAAARKFGVPRQTLMHRIKKGFPLEPKPSTGKSLSDFRAAHDRNFIVPKKIMEAIKKLGSSGWEYELPMLKLAGLSTTDLATFREQFAEYIVIVDRTKRVWCGSKELAQKLREMV